VDVEQDDVGSSLEDHLDCSFDFVGLADDSYVARELGTDAGPQERVIVD
jgi:hypothetical protein